MGVETGGWVRAAAATAAFAALHSATASSPAKAVVARVVGIRRRDALYRPAYNVLAALSSVALLWYVRRRHGRVLYHVPGPVAGLMRLGQCGALAYAATAAWRVGPLRFSGLPGLFAWVAGRPRIPREPEGQSPPPGDGFLPAAGPFRLSRHPLNFVLFPLLWLNPRMTTTLAASAVVTTLYAYLGSLHTDRRLRRLYGPAYDAYCRETPLLWPRGLRPVAGRMEPELIRQRVGAGA